MTMTSSQTFEFGISFLNNNPLNSDVVDARSGEKLYSITTEVKGLRRDMTVVRDARGETFAGWEQKSFGSDYVTFHGERCKLSKWLPKKNILSRLANAYWSAEECCTNQSAYISTAPAC